VLGAGLLITEALFEVPVLKPPRFMVERDTATARLRTQEATSRGVIEHGACALC
jgi:hypothetical protein